MWWYLVTTIFIEGIVKHIIPLYKYVVKKSSSTVSFHSSTNKLKEDNEFQIKTNSRIDLPLLQIASDAIQNNMDFSNFVTKDKSYGEKFTTYKNQSLESIKQF